MWLTVEVSQERNVSPTAMRLSLNDNVTLVRTSSAPATAFYQRAKSLLNVIVKCCSMLYTVVYTPPLFVHFDDNFSKWTCVASTRMFLLWILLELRMMEVGVTAQL